MIVRRAVEGDVATVFLGCRECHARALQQSLEVDTGRDAGSADARSETQLDASDRQRRGNHGEQPACRRGDVVLGDDGKQQPELVLAEACQGLLRECVADALGDCDEQLVARVGAHRLVDLAKAIEVEEEEHPEWMLASRLVADRPAEAFPVQHSGQVVMARHPVELVQVAAQAPSRPAEHRHEQETQHRKQAFEHCGDQ